MCDPVTLILLATGAKAIGTISEGRAVKERAEFEAAGTEQQAGRERLISKEEEEDLLYSVLIKLSNKQQ